VHRVFEDMTPAVEGRSIDDAFLDVRGLERISGTPTRLPCDSGVTCDPFRQGE
jgi:DNA polymerase-4